MKKKELSTKAVSFREWPKALGEVTPMVLRERMALTIKWYLGWCKQKGVCCSVHSAKRFLDEAKGEKKPRDSEYQNWREALLWFFRNAPKGEVYQGKQGHHPYEDEIPDTADEIENKWERSLAKALRRKHMMLKTEKAYRGWLKQFLKWLGEGKDPSEVCDTGIREFLDYLAIDRDLAPPTQKQALNALVFFYKHVLERKIDVSGFHKARERETLPVVLSEWK